MHRYLCLFVLLFTSIVQAAEPVKVMTFNVRYDGKLQRVRSGEAPWQADSGPSRRALVEKVIVAQSPDLLAIQEGLAHQVEQIQELLDGHAVYAVGREDGNRGGEHCAIYFRTSRFELVDSGTIWLCETPDKPGSKHPDAACTRISSWVRLADNQNEGREFLFVNTHWDHQSQPARQFAAQAIVDRLLPLAPAGRAIVVGDMNAIDDTPEMKLLKSNAQLPLTDAYLATHASDDPHVGTFNEFRNRVDGRRIDHVLVSPALTVRSAEIITTTFDGLNASDHFPVVAEIE